MSINKSGDIVIYVTNPIICFANNTIVDAELTRVMLLLWLSSFIATNLIQLVNDKFQNTIPVDAPLQTYRKRKDDNEEDDADENEKEHGKGDTHNHDNARSRDITSSLQKLVISETKTDPKQKSSRRIHSYSNYDKEIKDNFLLLTKKNLEYIRIKL